MSRKKSRRSTRRGAPRSRGRSSGMSLNRIVPVGVAVVGLLVVGAALMVLNKGRTPAGYEPSFTGGPRVEVSQETFDYGEVLINTTIQTEFEIRNVGDQPLKIAEVPVVEVREGC